MTLKELVEQVELQGDIQVKGYDWKTERYAVDEPHSHRMLQRYGNHEIKYMWAEGSELVVEIEAGR